MVKIDYINLVCMTLQTASTLPDSSLHDSSNSQKGVAMLFNSFECVSFSCHFQDFFDLLVISLCAGGMFTFPLISSILGVHCKLSQPQLTTIVLA